MIKATVPDFASRAVLMCGPQAFMDSLKTGLQGAGVPQHRIMSETFA